MRSRAFWLMCLCTIALVTACQPTKTSTPAPSLSAIVYEQTVQGKLSAAESHWLFLGKQDDSIAIQITFTGAPVPVSLIDPSGEPIARITANTGRLDRFRLPVDGTYKIIVGPGSGDYALALRSLAIQNGSATESPAPTAAASDKEIAVGDSRLGSLKPPVEQDIWRLSVQAGTIISIQMSSTTPDFGPVLQLFGPDGVLISRANANGDSGNALISGIQLPATGSYLIQASGKGRTGDYTLTVQAGVLPTPTPLPPPTAGPSPTPSPSPVPIALVGSQIRLGQTIEGQIADPKQVDRYAVFAPAGTVISIAMFRLAQSALVPAFEVFAPNGQQITQAAGANAAIVSGFTLPVTGAYIIFPHADQNRSKGSYSLSVGDGWTLRDFRPGIVQPDTPQQSTLKRTGDRDVWLIDLAAQTTFLVEVAPSQPGFQPVLEVVGPDGKQIGATLTNASSHLAKIEAMFAPVQGQYQIRVGVLPGAQAGTYSLTTHILRIDPTATFSVALDENIQAEVGPNERYTYSFKGTPGVVVLIEVHGKVDFDPVALLYGPGGRRLALADDSSADGTDAIIQIALDDSTGNYTVQIYGYANTPGAFTLHIKTQ